MEKLSDTHTPRKSSEESVSKSQTCRVRMAGSFCSVLSREKILSLFLTTTTCERQREGIVLLFLHRFNSWSWRDAASVQYFSSLNRFFFKKKAKNVSPHFSV